MYKKIGILGGTFDPFHKGHFQLAQTAYEQFYLDEIWIMPNGNPPHKKDQKQLDFSIRCEMIRLATAHVPYMHLCDAEGTEDGYHYTYETLEKFHQIYPEYAFYFIIGADSLRDFPTWREPEKIAGLCTLLAACRDDSGILELKEKIKEVKQRYDADCLIMNSPKIDVSSSEIREALLKGRDISSYVGTAVSEYIRQQKLYIL